MLNLFYDSEEVYSYENEDKIKQALHIDSIGEVYLDQNNKSIKYKINRRKCIRLQDLIFWIESDFVRIHLGQLLHLIVLLLNQVQLIESQGIEHNHLDLNRIWIHLTEQSQHPNLMYSVLEYSIHFTGYQCPFYEKQNTSQKASIQIKEIIQIICNRSFNRIHLKYTNKDKRDGIYAEIIKPIMDLCKSNQSSIYEIILYIQDQMKKHNYQTDLKNKLIQCLDIDDNMNDYIGSQRHQAIPKVNKDLTAIIQFGTQYGQVIIESLLYQTIPIISQHLEYYSQFKWNLDYMLKAKEQYDIIKERESKVKYSIEQQVQNVIKNLLKNKEKEFKFETTEDEINQLQKEIISQIFQSQFVNYFNNTYWLHLNNQDIHNYQIAAATRQLFQVVQDKVDLLFILKKISLIDEII